MGSGPSNPEPRVLQAMSAAPLAASDPACGQLLEDLASLERAVFGTRNRCTLAVPGASRAGIEAALASLIEPGDRVLVGVYGHFGELLCSLADRHGASVERVDAEWGRPVDVERLIARIRSGRPRLVAIVHADTSTGVLQPLHGIGQACREVGALLLVDAVLSLGGCAVRVDDWHIDAAIGGLQKCLGGPPGLALVTVSERARQAVAARRSRPHSAYLDLGLARDRRGSPGVDAEGAPRAERLGSEADPDGAELSTSMLLAAREACRLVLDEGLDARWQRHQRASGALRAGLAAMGLELFGELSGSVPMITLVRVPDGIDEAGVRAQLLSQHGIEIMAAFGPLRGRVWRIGAMGTNARLSSVLAVVAGLEAVLAGRGFRLARGAGVDAVLAAAAALGLS